MPYKTTLELKVFSLKQNQAIKYLKMQFQTTLLSFNEFKK